MKNYAHYTWKKAKENWIVLLLLVILGWSNLPVRLAQGQTIPADNLAEVCGAFSIQHRDYIDSDGNNVTVAMSVGDTGVNHDNWFYRMARINGLGVIQDKVWEHLVEPARAQHSFKANPGELFLLTFFVPTDNGQYGTINCGVLSFEVEEGKSDFSGLDAMLNSQQQPSPEMMASSSPNRQYMPLIAESGAE